MPTVSTKLKDAEVKILKEQAEAQGYSLAAYIRKELRPKITQKQDTPPGPSVGKIKRILQE